MADNVYRRFTPDDLFHTTVRAHPGVTVESGSSGWSGNTILGTNALSLYGGVRSRSDIGPTASLTSSPGLRVYPLDEVDTHSIDKVLGIPGQYPQTGSINLVYCTDTSGVATDTRWHDLHWSAVGLLSDWYHNNRYYHFPALDALPATFTALHVPEMFYGRHIASGSVYIWTHAWDSASGSNSTSGTQYWADDGVGRLWRVPSGSRWAVGQTGSVVGYVFYNEGLVILTNPSATWHNEFVSASYNLVSGTNPNLHFEFSGTTIMQSWVFMCRMPQGVANASNNPTYYYTGSDGLRYSKFPATGTVGQNRTYITAIGIYNEERQLVAVAKIAQPIRKRETDNIDARLKMDI